MQKRSINGLYKKLRLSTRYVPQRSFTLEGIPITDSYKLRPYKLCLDKLRPHNLRDKPRSNLKFRKNVRSNVRKNFWKNLRKNFHRQPQGIKHLKCFRLPYLSPCLKLRNKLRKNLRGNLHKRLSTKRSLALEGIQIGRAHV